MDQDQRQQVSDQEPETTEEIEIGNRKSRDSDDPDSDKDSEVEFEPEEVSKDDEDTVEDHDYICEVCLQGGETILCDDCPHAYHLDCLEPKLEEAPEGKWSCPQCETESEEDDEEEDESNEFCTVCKDGGKLLYCHSCPWACHTFCLDPPLKEIPDGDWRCPRCSCDPMAGRVVSILNWRWKETTEEREKYWLKPKEEREYLTEPSREYFVHFSGLSYWNCDWVTELQMEVFHPTLLRSYWKTVDKETPPSQPNLDVEDPLVQKFYVNSIRPEWLQVHLILNHKSNGDGSMSYLVKWKELSHYRATWEDKEQCGDLVPGFKLAVEVYHEQRQRDMEAVCFDENLMPVIFKHLDLDSLVVAGAVCLLWFDLSEEALKSRINGDHLPFAEGDANVRQGVTDLLERAFGVVEIPGAGPEEGYRGFTLNQNLQRKIPSQWWEAGEEDCTDLQIEKSTPLISAWFLCQKNFLTSVRNLHLWNVITETDWNDGFGRFLLSMGSLQFLQVFLTSRNEKAVTNAFRTIPSCTYSSPKKNTSLKYLLLHRAILTNLPEPLLDLKIVATMCSSLRYFRLSQSLMAYYSRANKIFEVLLSFLFLGEETILRCFFKLKNNAVPSLGRVPHTRRTLEEQLRIFSQLFPYTGLELDVTEGTDLVYAGLSSEKLKSVSLRFLTPSARAYHDAAEAVKNWSTDAAFSELSHLSLWFPTAEEKPWFPKTHRLITSPPGTATERVGLQKVTSLQILYGSIKTHEASGTLCNRQKVGAFWKYMMQHIPSVSEIVSNGCTHRAFEISLAASVSSLNFVRFLERNEDVFLFCGEIRNARKLERRCPEKVRLTFGKGLNPVHDLDINRSVEEYHDAVQAATQRRAAEAFAELPFHGLGTLPEMEEEIVAKGFLNLPFASDDLD